MVGGSELTTPSQNDHTPPLQACTWASPHIPLLDRRTATMTMTMIGVMTGGATTEGDMVSGRLCGRVSGTATC